MPVTYFSSTGALSFEPVPVRDQAIGPIDVALSPTPPDEITQPRDTGKNPKSRRYRRISLVAALAGLGGLYLAF